MRRAEQTLPLRRAAAEPTIRYTFDGALRSIDDYLAGNPASGLLVARGDTIHVERYQYARREAMRFSGHSSYVLSP